MFCLSLVRQRSTLALSKCVMPFDGSNRCEPQDAGTVSRLTWALTTRHPSGVRIQV